MNTEKVTLFSLEEFCSEFLSEKQTCELGKRLLKEFPDIYPQMVVPTKLSLLAISGNTLADHLSDLQIPVPDFLEDNAEALFELTNIPKAFWMYGHVPGEFRARIEETSKESKELAGVILNVCMSRNRWITLRETVELANASGEYKLRVISEARHQAYHEYLMSVYKER